MEKILNYLKNNKHLFLLLYAAIYVPWFVYIDTHVPDVSQMHLIHMAIDDYIPFIGGFVIAYALWFPYMFATIIYVAFWDGKSCWKLGAMLITGMTLFLVISTVYPNYQDLRPTEFANNNFFIHIIRDVIYAADAPANLFPSIHVYNSIACHVCLLNCKAGKRFRIIRIFSWILCIAISASTVLIKQHSMFDVITALILGIIMWLIVYRPWRKTND